LEVKAMKRVAVLLIVLTVCLMPLSGCANSDASGGSSDSDSKTPETRVTIERTKDLEGKFTPTGEGQDDQGKDMILYSSSEIDLTEGGKSATVELFVKAEQADGEILWDDGQYWYLIVRDGDSVFKLLDDVYLQLGRVNYWAYWSYDEKAPHLLVMVQEGAGIREYVYTYDKDSDVFYRDDVFVTTGNISVISSRLPDCEPDAVKGS